MKVDQLTGDLKKILKKKKIPYIQQDLVNALEESVVTQFVVRGIGYVMEEVYSEFENRNLLLIRKTLKESKFFKEPIDPESPKKTLIWFEQFLRGEQLENAFVGEKNENTRKALNLYLPKNNPCSFEEMKRAWKQAIGTSTDEQLELFFLVNGVKMEHSSFPQDRQSFYSMKGKFGFNAEFIIKNEKAVCTVHNKGRVKWNWN